MNERLVFDVKLTASAPGEPVPLAIRAGSVVLTSLLRSGSKRIEEYLEVDPEPLAFWLVDNWWRLRWECPPPGRPTADWRMRHELSSIPAYAWPRLSIWGDGEEVLLRNLSDPPGVAGPVRYVTDALVAVRGGEYERAVDRFVLSVIEHHRGKDIAALKGVWDQLIAERRDPEFSVWRKLEAQSGFDVDQAPEALMQMLADCVAKFGEGGVAEATLAHPGDDAATTLIAEISALERVGVECDFGAVPKLSNTPSHLGEPAWRDAEQASAMIRKSLGLSGEPLTSETLASLLDVDAGVFEGSAGRSASPRLAYGLRLGQDFGVGKQRVALQSQRPAARRFEFSRALGDAIRFPGEQLGPLSSAKTYRQKFQRAFAQSLLCPFDSLMEYLGNGDFDDEDLESAAEHFGVSERVVRTTLVKKGVLSDWQLDEVEAA